MKKHRQGIVRTIVTRVGVQTGELQVVIITCTKRIAKN